MVRFLKTPALLIAPLALALAAPAHAQNAAKAITVEIGPNYAMNSDVRDATQDIGIHVGLGYRLPVKTVNPDHPSWTTVGVMYNQNSKHGNKLDVLGLTAEQRYSVAKPGSTSSVRPYVGIGVGVYRVHAKAGDYEPPVSSGLEDVVAGRGQGSSEGDYDDSETKTRIGGRLMAGLEFSNAYYAELAYNLTGKIEDVRSDSLTLSVGARF